MTLVVKVKAFLFAALVVVLTMGPFLVYLVIPFSKLITISLFISTALLLAFVLILTKSPRYRAFLSAFIVMLVVIQVLFYSDSNLQHRIICSTFGRQSVAEIIHQENSERASVTLCGNLRSCDVLNLANGEPYEVCLIDDLVDPEVGTVYVNQRIIYSPDGDPLVQISHELNALRTVDSATLVIRSQTIIDTEASCSVYAIENPFAECVVTYSSDGLRRSLGE
ncbi:MAG: hypothetical protein CL607_17170 [Anaerolineaceae bacterium]|nr:hypothetical protein [Anaerolineaceae bacterium]